MAFKDYLNPRIVLPLIASVFGVGIVGTLTERPPPDSPLNFGYKCAWLAVRSESPDKVVSALGLRHVEHSTWQNGINAAYDGKVFVTPPLGDWILVVSFALPDPEPDRPDEASPFLLKLGKEFSEVQYFATHRVVEFHAWARLVDGKFVRRVAYLGEQGVGIWNDGKPTPTEEKLGLVFPALAEDWKNPPDEDDVMAVAREWSIDPSNLEAQHYPLGLGLLGSWKD